MNIKPIKNEYDYRAALAEIERLLDAMPGTAESDCLDVWTTLVEAYEAEHDPIQPPDDPIEAICYYMESRGLSRADLEPYIGSIQWVEAVLERKRPLTIEMIRKLYEGLDIPAEVLIQPYAVFETAA